MTSREKRIERFCNIRTEAEFREAIWVLGIIGYRIKRMHGSHFIFESPDGEPRDIAIPVHCNKIKKIYIRKIQKLINQYYEKI